MTMVKYLILILLIWCLVGTALKFLPMPVRKPVMICDGMKEDEHLITTKYLTIERAADLEMELYEMVVVGGQELRDSVCLKVKYTVLLRDLLDDPVREWKNKKLMCIFLQEMQLNKMKECPFDIETAVFHHEPTVSFFSSIKVLYAVLERLQYNAVGLLEANQTCWNDTDSYQYYIFRHCQNKGTIECIRPCQLKLYLKSDIVYINPGTDPLDWFLDKAPKFNGYVKSLMLHIVPNENDEDDDDDDATNMTKPVHKLNIKKTGLQELVVFGHLLRYRDIGGFDNSPVLKTLTLSGVGFGDLQVNFSSIPRLEDLRIGYNKLTKLPAGVGKLSKLCNLDLRGNLFYEIPSNILGLTKLRFLNLERNRISSLPSWIVSLSELIYLNLNYNTIGDIIVQLPPNLYYIYLKNIKLSTWPTNKLRYLTKLTELDMSENDIKVFDENFYLTFENTLKLSDLDLSSISLGGNLSFLRSYSIKDKERGTLSELTKLILSKCNIKVLNSEDFSQLTSLRELDLSSNYLKSVPATLTVGLSWLSSIDLSNNRLVSIPGFIHWSGNLNMSRNNVVYPNNTCDYCSIYNLDLSHNKIATWSDEDVFGKSSNSNIGSLDLSYNKITAFTLQMMKSLNTVEDVDLQGNILNCDDCKMGAFNEWILYKTNTNIVSFQEKKLGGYLFPQPVNLTCTLPASKQGMLISDAIEIDERCFIILASWTSVYVVGSITLMLLMTIVVLTVMAYKYRVFISYTIHMFGIRNRRTNYVGRDGYEFDAFICYCGSDRDWVMKELQPRLESGPEYFRLCLHERDFPLGSSIIGNIESAILNSRNVIMVVSSSFVNSQWCKIELEWSNNAMFIQKRTLIVIVQLEDLDRSLLPRHLKLLMDTRTFLRWPEIRSRQDAAWKRLKEALGESLYQHQRQNMGENEIAMVDLA